MSVFRPGLYAGKVALITGGGTGIGKAITKELLSLGCNVGIASRNIDKLKKTQDELSGKFPGTIKCFPCNIRKEDDARSTIEWISSEFGALNFLVNNGGGQFPSPVADMSLKGWNAVIDTNLNGTYLMSREAYNQVFKTSGGSIVNIIAQTQRGFPMMGHTGAARAGVENLTKTLALEWAQNGVRVNSVAPGPVFSPTASDNYAYDLFSAVKTNLPTKRCGTPEEVSSSVCFLLSPGASFISGATLMVDGGSVLYSPPMYSIPEHDKQPPYTWDES
eukprot:TRINITY_DN6245_c0_g1_i1.p1 TRINITY_DN6245_c0_g1~~TRINITY_DN6245_c0_g1_i1.p1  ORF type:complete len:276 (-),score=25.96 TRINITY_DN6245_c0_g1_i1:18-845(-)